MVYLDFETRSLVDLKKVGAYAYARHPSTEIVCLGYTSEDRIEIWTPFSKKLPEFKETLVAWNAQFDYYIYKYVAVPKYGFPEIPLEQWQDLMACAAYNGYPLALDKCAGELGFEGKLKSGKQLINLLCKPMPGTDSFVEYSSTTASDFHRFYNYCKQDVRLLESIHSRLHEIPDFEHKVWRQTVWMNERGLPMDQHELTCIIDHVEAAQEKLDARTAFITGGQLESVNQVGKLKRFVAKSVSVPVPDMTKETVSKLLEHDIPNNIRALLENRRAVGLTSNKKFKKALQMWYDGAVHDTLQYYGAHTGRYSGRGFQLQNLNRQSLKDPETVIEDLIAFIPEEIGFLYDPKEILEMTGRLVRSIIRAPEGYKIICADFGSIEAIAAPWITGEQSILDAFVKGHDLYKTAASEIFGVAYDKVSKDQRQAGKLLTLACIAKGQRVLTDTGWVPIERITTDMKVWDGNKFVSHDGAVCRGYKEVMTYDGLQATPDHIVWIEEGKAELQEAARKGLRIKRVCGPSGRLVPTKRQTKREVWDILNAGPRQRFTVEGRLVHNCGYAGGYRALMGMAQNYGVDMPEATAKELVGQFRYARPRLTNAWKVFERAAFEALNTGKTCTVQNITVPFSFTRAGSDIWMRLPSGRGLVYRDVNLIRNERMASTIECRIRDHTKQLSGANLFQNAVQAVCRDLLVEAQLRLDEAGYPIFLSIHDECAALVPDSERYSLKDFIRIMIQVPSWASGMVIKADGFESYRYRK